MASATVRFIGDLHFLHKNLIIGLRGFTSVEEHDQLIINNWNKTVRSPKDLTFILGDIGMEKLTSYPMLDLLMGRKIIIGGNHERYQDSKELMKYVDGIVGMMDYKGFILTHCPIHESLIESCRGNIHGHVHSKSIWSEYGVLHPKYFNVSAEVIDYTPITIEQLINK